MIGARMGRCADTNKTAILSGLGGFLITALLYVSSDLHDYTRPPDYNN